MTVAFDAFGLTGDTGTGELSFSHNPVGTPKAAIVQIVQEGDTDEVTGVTYGGTSMTEVTDSPNSKSSGEASGVHTYFLGSSIPTGSQEIVVSVNGTGSKKSARALTLTADTDTEVVDTDVTINSDSLEDPSATLSLSSRTSFAAIALFSGHATSGAITPLTNWTSRAEQSLTGFANIIGFYTYDTIGTSDVTAGWTQTADDAVAIALAVSEVQAADFVPKNKGSRIPSVHRRADTSPSIRTIGPRGESGR